MPQIGCFGFFLIIGALYLGATELGLVEEDAPERDRPAAEQSEPKVLPVDVFKTFQRACRPANFIPLSLKYNVPGIPSRVAAAYVKAEYDGPHDAEARAGCIKGFRG